MNRPAFRVICSKGSLLMPLKGDLATLGRIGLILTELPIQDQQPFARHLQLRQRQQRGQLYVVPSEGAVAHLHVPELPFDHAKPALERGAHAGLGLLYLLDETVYEVGLVQRTALSRALRNMPVHAVLGIGPLGGDLVAGFTERVTLQSVQQAVGLDHIVDVGSRASNNVHQPRLDADVRHHAEAPLVALLGLVHFKVELAPLIPGRTGCCDQRGIEYRSGLEHQRFVAQLVVDHGQDLIGQLLPLKQEAKVQDRAFVGPPAAPPQAGELEGQRNVVQRLFHRSVAQREPLLHAVDAQRRLHGKRRSALFALRRTRHHHFDQRSPRHPAFHLRKKLPLARSRGRQVQSQADLFYASNRRCSITHWQAHLLEGQTFSKRY